MRITGQGIWGPPKDESEAITLLRRMVYRGVTFIDTADSPGPGISETIRLIATYRSNVMNAVPPTGAGFSYNWGGRLAREISDSRPMIRLSRS